MSMGQVCYKVPKFYKIDNIESDVHDIFIEKNTVFTVFSGIIQNLVVSVCYYHTAFFSNVETQL